MIDSKKNIFNFHLVVLFLLLGFFGPVAHAAEVNNQGYIINPGDTLGISVWKEEELIRERRVLPDGSISFPLAGTIQVAGKSVKQVEAVLTKKISDYITDPVINVSLNSVEGNVVYAIGQVKAPGQFIMYQPMDVMQILSLAGGLTPFAKSNSIKILRRTAKESVAIDFEYSDIADGDNLDKNLILKSGDVIVVP